MLSGDGNENSQKESVGLISKKKNFARAAHFFGHFFAVFWHDYNEKLPRMPIYRVRTRLRTRQFFAFPPFSRPAISTTINRRVFVAIMEARKARVRVWLGLGLG